MRFHQLEGETVILRTNGVFMQTSVYVYNSELFAKRGARYIRLVDSGKTSVPITFWQDLSMNFVVGEYGRLTVANNEP